MSTTLNDVPMWPEPASMIDRQRVDPARVGERRGARDRVLERADALELGGRHVAQLDRRVGGEGGGFHQAASRQRARLARGDRARPLEVVGVVDREALVALGEERHDAPAGDLAVGDDPRPGDLQRGVLHVDLAAATAVWRECVGTSPGVCVAAAGA